MKRDLYADVTARILAELENGTVPWIKPWRSTPGMNHPHNAATGRPYSGCNVVLLWIAADNGWPTPRFLTFQQALALKGNVRKGEKGTKVYFVKRMNRQDDSASDGDEGETRSFTMLREYTVFNIAQCENLPEKIVTPPPAKVINTDERDATIDEFLTATRADIREGHGEAYYRPSDDYVSLPAFAAFKNADHFYATAFHELGHWTGHKSRLDRDLKNRFGDKQYAAEELVAELCAAFLCAEFNLDNDLRHAGYINSWIALLKSDSRAFMTAANKAQAAADHLRNLAIAEPVQEAA